MSFPKQSSCILAVRALLSVSTGVQMTLLDSMERCRYRRRLDV